MTNLTLRIDDSLLDRARKYAADQGTTVAKLVREHLMQITDAADRAEQGRRILVDLAERAEDRRVDWTWNREEIYAERLSRFEHHLVRGAAAERGARKSDRRQGSAEED